jgi:hypothetical protein
MFEFYNSNRSANKIIIAIDLEWYDQTNGEHPTEIGLAIQADNDNSTNQYIHYAIHENSVLQ